MTLNEIIVAALQQLKRGKDSQTIESYRGAFTQYANMAQQDLAKHFPQYRTDPVTLEDGGFAVSCLPRWCTKVIGVTQNGNPVAFDAGAETGLIAVAAQGEVLVRYRTLPRPLENTTDSPDLPAQLHPAIVSYVVASDRAEGDASTQGGSALYFRIYQEQKRQLLRGGYGTPGSYRIENM